MADKSPGQVREEFDDAVNMTPKELEEWLETDESQSVGQDDGGESTGHKSGRGSSRSCARRRATSPTTISST